jgi:hypothetical protein
LWFCAFTGDRERLARGTGATAREAIRHALEQAGVDEPPYETSVSPSDAKTVKPEDVR